MVIYRVWPTPMNIYPNTVPTYYFHQFSWAKSHNFLIMQKSKFTEIHNICSNWLLLQSINRTCFQQMLTIFVNFYFCLRDHSSITSSKRWVGGVRKWQFLMIYSTVNRVGSCVSSPFSRCTPILDWSE